MGREEIFTNIKAALRTQDRMGTVLRTEGDGSKDRMGTVLFCPFQGQNRTVPILSLEPSPSVLTVELFIDLLVDYKATVECADDSSQIAVLVARFLKQAQAETCVVPPGLDPAWFAAAQTAGIQVRVDNPPLSKEELDQTSAVITAACLGMAETGTIVLDHRADQGRRIISLLPDTHICVIRSDQIAAGVSEAMVHLAPLLQEGQPLTWISGPSATSDIELSRVEGVHGPRNLYVILVT
ncbi:MAG: LUD domain-containing protein [Coriobacteriia bacterium]|nr:LUD domain-containing protein [Coriobacteriia bacterium]